MNITPCVLTTTMQVVPEKFSRQNSNFQQIFIYSSNENEIIFSSVCFKQFHFRNHYYVSHYFLTTLTNSDKSNSAMLSWRLWKDQIFLFQRKFFCSGKFLNIFRTFFDDGGESDCCHVAALISPSLFVVIIFSQNNGSEC